MPKKSKINTATKNDKQKISGFNWCANNNEKQNVMKNSNLLDKKHQIYQNTGKYHNVREEMIRI